MNIQQYAIGALIGVMIITGAMLKSAWKKNGELKAQLTEAHAQLNEAADVNDHNVETIEMLMETIDNMVALRATEAAENERILAERARELQAAIARANALEQERRDEITENQECRSLAELDVVRFCPAISSQLLWRSRGESGDRSPDGPSTG